MTIEQLRALYAECVRHMTELAEGLTEERSNFDEAEQTRWDTLEGWVRDTEAAIDRLERIGRLAASPRNTIPGDQRTGGGVMDRDPIGDEGDLNSDRGNSPWNLDELRTWGRRPEQVAGDLRARALDCIERASGMTDARRETLTQILEQHDPTSGPDAGALSRHVIIASDPDYLSAFGKLMRGRGNMLTEAEQGAVERGMSLTDGEGGYLIPQQLDPTLILTSDGSVNPFRQLATKKVGTGDTWNGVSTTHASWSWDAEGAEVSDDATTFALPAITIHKAAGFIPITGEALQDEPNVTDAIGRVLALGKDDLEATALATGSGSGQPVGLVTALVASASSASVVASASANTFAVADLYAMHNAVPAKYRSSSSWIANNTTYNLIRAFGTSDSHALWTRLADDLPMGLLGRPHYEASAMDATYGSGENYTMIFGDISNYVIVDRLGMTVEFVPHLFHTANNRPSGKSGFYARTRFGADSVNDGSMRVLNIT